MNEVGTRSPAGTGHRMRRRSGSCWTALIREPWPLPCSGPTRAADGAPAGRPAEPAARTPAGPPRKMRAEACFGKNLDLFGEGEAGSHGGQDGGG
jgi:hypothetical protein